MIFKKSLSASQGSTLDEQRAWRRAVYGEVMQLEGKGGLSITEACEAAHVSRAGFYRHFDDHAPQQADTELRDQIQQICWQSRSYGYRRGRGRPRPPRRRAYGPRGSRGL